MWGSDSGDLLQDYLVVVVDQVVVAPNHDPDQYNIPPVATLELLGGGLAIVVGGIESYCEM